MPSQKDIFLYAGDATPKDIILRVLPVADLVSTIIYLVEGDATPKNIILFDPTVQPDAGGGGPGTFFGLRIYYGGSVQDLALVDVADGDASMGGIPLLRKDGTTFAVLLVETGDADASNVRMQTTAGTKSIRMKA